MSWKCNWLSTRAFKIRQQCPARCKAIGRVPREHNQRNSLKYSRGDSCLPRLSCPAVKFHSVKPFEKHDMLQNRIACQLHLCAGAGAISADRLRRILGCSMSLNPAAAAKARVSWNSFSATCPTGSTRSNLPVGLRTSLI